MKWIKNPNVMYKFGKTHQTNADNRFKEQTADFYGFEHIALEKGYTPKTMWSRYVPENVADRLEALFKKRIPKTVWTDVQYNGITECRVFTREEVDDILEGLSKQFPAEVYGRRKRGYVKIYFTRFTKKPKTEYDNS